MADLWGALAQSDPAATTLTDVYTVPAGKVATIEVVSCNRGAATTIRLSHAIDGAADSNEQYVVYDLTIDANAAQSTKKIAVSAADVIRAYSASGNVSFTVNGIEESNDDA